MSDTANTKELLTLTTEIVAAHVSKNSVAAADLPQLIAQVYQSLANVGKGQAQATERPDPAVPVKKSVHAIIDNYATHKHPKVRQWLARHPRWTFHFTPTSASWLNAVEGFFAKLTKRRLKRGVFPSVVDLQVAINRFVAEHNADRPMKGRPIRARYSINLPET